MAISCALVVAGRRVDLRRQRLAGEQRQSFEAIYNAETRLGPLGVFDSTQCMPRIDMLYAYTINAAKLLMMDKSIGSIEPGKFADMVLVDRDILAIAPEAMLHTKVLWTMFEGKIVYREGETFGTRHHFAIKLLLRRTLVRLNTSRKDQRPKARENFVIV